MNITPLRRGPLCSALVLCLLASTAFGQSGGSLKLTSAVTSAGGGSSTGPGNVSLDGTVGQPTDNAIIGQGDFTLRSGFWPTTFHLPLGAPATLGGVVTALDGTPLGGVVITLSGGSNTQTITDQKGRYLFDEVRAGSSYTLTAQLANYNFSPNALSLTLMDNKSDASFVGTPISPPNANPLDTGLFFVRQHYLDFLSREPDRGGLLYWSFEITRCGADAPCTNSRRVGVSAAFFIEQEFQLTGFYIFRLYRAGLGRRLSYAEFNADRQQVIGGPNLETSMRAFADAFVQRAEFVQKYQSATTADSFVDAIIQTVLQVSGVDLSAQRGALIDNYQTGSSQAQSRSIVLREVAKNSQFKQAGYNPAFVLIQYFGYLRRDPDSGGLAFWIDVLNNKEPNNYRGMVCSFITSAEYQMRFSSVVTHSNKECPGI